MTVTVLVIPFKLTPRENDPTDYIAFQCGVKTGFFNRLFKRSQPILSEEVMHALQMFAKQHRGSYFLTPEEFYKLY